MVPVDLITYQDKLRTQKQPDGSTFIFDTVRRRWLSLQPEEMVRQLFIHYCLAEGICPASRISIEKQITVNEIVRRYDVALYNSKGQPEVLVECKAPAIVLDRQVFEQIAHYNMAMRVPYLVVTNGMHTHAFQIDFSAESFSELEHIPVVT